MSSSGPDDPQQPQGLGAPHGDSPGFVPPPGPYSQGFGRPGGPSPYGQPTPHGQGYGPYGQLGGPQQQVGQGSPQPPYAPVPPQGQVYGPGYPQQPYRPGPPPPPYGPGGPGPAAPRGTRPRTALVLVVVLLLVAGVGVGAWAVLNRQGADVVTQPTPTRAATSSRPATTPTRTATTTTPTAGDGPTGFPTDCLQGEKVTSGSWVATVPSGWECDGEEYDLSLSSANYDAMWLDHATGGGDASDCRDKLYGLGTVTELPNQSWGGITAFAYESEDSGDIYGVRCVVSRGVTYYLGYFPLDASDRDSVRASVSSLLATWVWK